MAETRITRTKRASADRRSADELAQAANELAMSQSKVASPAPRREDKPQKAKQPDGPPVSKLKMGLSDVGGSVFAQPEGQDEGEPVALSSPGCLDGSTRKTLLPTLNVEEPFHQSPPGPAI